MQKAGGRRQEAGGKRKEAEGMMLEAGGRRKGGRNHAEEGRRPEEGGRRQRRTRQEAGSRSSPTAGRGCTVHCRLQPCCLLRGQGLGPLVGARGFVASSEQEQEGGGRPRLGNNMTKTSREA